MRHLSRYVQRIYSDGVCILAQDIANGWPFIVYRILEPKLITCTGINIGKNISVYVKSSIIGCFDIEIINDRYKISIDVVRGADEVLNEILVVLYGGAVV